MWLLPRRWNISYDSVHGGFSEYSVLAETPEDFSATVKFASDHNLRLVVKGTGHDWCAWWMCWLHSYWRMCDTERRRWLHCDGSVVVVVVVFLVVEGGMGVPVLLLVVVVVKLLHCTNPHAHVDSRGHLSHARHNRYGRSTAAGSLLLWTHLRKNITYHDSFVAEGCDASTAVPAATIESGVQFMDL